MDCHVTKGLDRLLSLLLLLSPSFLPSPSQHVSERVWVWVLSFSMSLGLPKIIGGRQSILEAKKDSCQKLICAKRIGKSKKLSDPSFSDGPGTSSRSTKYKERTTRKGEGGLP